MKYLIVILISLLLLSCSSSQSDKLIIGLIKPSLNHLPLQYALENIEGDHTAYQIEYFHSGWETNEALVAGKIDLAIMPFTYIWMDVSQDKKVKIISFFERESDGIIASKEFTSLAQLQNGKLGVLKSSTLEIIPEMVFAQQGLSLPEILFFRTPMDMAAALKAGEVDALSYYVPSILNFPEDYHIIDWYSSTFPQHTCCNIAATELAIASKDQLIKSFLTLLNHNPQKHDKLIPTAIQYYGLPAETVKNSLLHTRYIMGLDQKGIDFETKAADIMLQKGYLKRKVTPDEVYHKLLP